MSDNAFNASAHARTPDPELDLGRFFPLSAAEVSGLLLFGLENRPDLKLKARNTVIYNQTEFTIRSTGPHCIQTFWTHLPTERAFRFNGWRCISDAPENKGLTKKLFANRLALAHALGVRCMTSSFANIGAYAMARMGFLPYMPIAENLNSVMAFAEKRANQLHDYGKISDTQHNAITAIVARTNVPEALWQLADLRDDIRGTPLGFYLLRDNCWAGVFTLDKPDQMARARAYIGPDHFDAVMDMAESIKVNAQARTGYTPQNLGVPLP